jgi:hypothetical protein
MQYQAREQYVRINTALGDEKTSGERPGMNIPRFGEIPKLHPCGKIAGKMV